MNCRVVVEAAVPVFDVETEDEAIRIAISKTGEMLNPDLNYVEINMGERTSPSGEELPPAFIAADEALVALELEMTVFNVEREEHASRIARKEIGQRLENIPLEVEQVEVIEDEDEGEEEADDEATDDAADADADDTTVDNDDADGRDTEPSETDTESESSSNGDETDGGENTRVDDDTDEQTDEEILPEFEDLVE
ncbi:UPF0212 family protein [Natrialba magadii ATCC 43099]|uniref:UPF0212 protein Nmag_0524 n=1 Tax=Natrialba magadii (strain ATCC 43099 / DSM 3394 / CCM 3739 / CIP 104546 / IAM 13178 / JCM 8861 / NBRC 102185 / NCIMB 2190 / MS3) TaxID=547559 RepID=D3SYK0_NATMM|nr:DUF555 domain-containing protein [Natrialba magadii]ADD04111.1 UPF0212 family protein [Natrialba magadii ATCC 43099]ELY33268.1 hypothetical protein C500_03029 [Natrialba magadii ATCC 43099]